MAFRAVAFCCSNPVKPLSTVVPEGGVDSDVVCVCGGGGVSANVRQHAHMSDVLGWHVMLLVYVYLASLYVVSCTYLHWSCFERPLCPRYCTSISL